MSECLDLCALPGPGFLPGTSPSGVFSSVTPVLAMPTLPPAHTALSCRLKNPATLTQPETPIWGGRLPCQLSPCPLPAPTSSYQQICWLCLQMGLPPPGPTQALATSISFLEISNWFMCCPLGPTHPSPLSVWREEPARGVLPGAPAAVVSRVSLSCQLPREAPRHPVLSRDATPSPRTP